ncbi:MAG: P-loop NTPase [Spirochaetota bacterium]
MKIAVTGKGGVGKSTIVALMARVLKDSGLDVLIIDADPDMNQSTLLGIPDSRSITPIVELKELIAERTGTEVGRSAPFFKMNPKVSDIPEKYWVEHRGIKLLVMGTIARGGGGCACPENAFLKSLLSHLVLSGDEWVLLDMEAGIEHLGRGTAVGVDLMIVVVEPNKTSFETALRIKKLSSDLGLKKLGLIANKIQNLEERAYVQEQAKQHNLIGILEYNNELKKISTGEISVMELSSGPIENIRRIIKTIKIR